MDLEKLKTIKAVVFDMDGLMFDSEHYVQKSWDIAGEKLGYGPLGYNIVNTLGTNLTNRKKYFLKHYGNDFPFDEFLQTYRHIMIWQKMGHQQKKDCMRFWKC